MRGAGQLNKTDDRPLPFGRCEGSAVNLRPKIWEKFCADEALLRTHRISSAELQALSRVAILGSYESRDDLLFMLSMLRKARR